jgi:hypothetical protein
MGNQKMKLEEQTIQRAKKKDKKRNNNLQSAA